MKIILGLALLAAMGFAAEQKMNLDWNKILTNDRFYQIYYDCIMETGKCTPEGKMMKERIVDRVKDKCAACDPEATKHAVSFMIQNKPADFEAFEKKYDPEHIFRKFAE